MGGQLILKSCTMWSNTPQVLVYLLLCPVLTKIPVNPYYATILLCVVPKQTIILFHLDGEILYNPKRNQWLWALVHLMKDSHCIVGHLIVGKEIITCQLIQVYLDGKCHWLSRELQFSDVPIAFTAFDYLCASHRSALSVSDSQHLPWLCSSVKDLYNTCLPPHQKENMNPEEYTMVPTFQGVIDLKEKNNLRFKFLFESLSSYRNW